MEISSKTRIADLLDRYPFMQDFLVTLSPKFKLLKNPVMRTTIGSVATLGQAASIGGIAVEKLVGKIADKIELETGEKVRREIEKVEMEAIGDTQARHEILKDIIRDLHDGLDMTTAKRRFRELIKDVDASEISKMEQKLIEEGMPQDEVKRLCDVHVEIFKESLERQDTPTVPEEHPVHTFMRENRACEELMDEIERLAGMFDKEKEPESFSREASRLGELIANLRKIEIHYQRKENQLFPLLEKHDISGPSEVMWALHDDIREMLKKTAAELEVGDGSKAVEYAGEALRTIRDMIYKEEHILYPLAIETLSDDEWQRVRQGEAEIGYAWIAPNKTNETRIPTNEPKENAVFKNSLTFDTGSMTLEQANLVLKHLPLDISFVDENDEVVYYSATKERLFPRSPAVIGRTVQKCHPPTSVHVVQKILNDFRAGNKDVAEFWIQMHGKFVHIRYFAVRDDKGKYRGCLEVTQDVGGIRELEGERRLLDW